MSNEKSTSGMPSARQIARLLKKINLHDHDIIMLKSGKFDEQDIMEMLRKGVESLGLKKVFVIVTDDFDDLKVLNQQEMNNLGWYNISQINRVTDRMPKRG